MTINTAPAKLNPFENLSSGQKTKNSGYSGMSFKESMDNVEGKASDGPPSTRNKKDLEVKEEISSTNREVTKVVESEQDEGANTEAIDDGKIDNVIDSIKKILVKKLNISDEELAEIMANLQMNFIDLTDMNNLMEFIQSALGIEDISMILVDEELNQTVMEVMEDVNAIIDEDVKNQIKLFQYEVFVESKVEETDVDEVVTADHNAKVNPDDSKDSDNKNKLLSNAGESLEDISIEVINSGEPAKDLDEGKAKGDTDSNHGLLNEFVGKVSNEFNHEAIEIQHQPVSMEEIINQIVEKIKVDINPEQKSLELQLNPENLGRVNLTVSESGGILTAEILVENEMAKTAVESQMSILMESLDNQGLKVEALEVTLASFEFKQGHEAGDHEGSYQEQGRNKKSITLDEAMGLSMQEIEDEILEEMMVASGSSVNYTA